MRKNDLYACFYIIVDYFLKSTKLRNSDNLTNFNGLETCYQGYRFE